MTPDILEAWEIDAIDRSRRIRDGEQREYAQIPLVDRVHPVRDGHVPSSSEAVTAVVWQG